MKANRLLREPDAGALLAKRLATCATLTKYDTVERKEADTLAHGFADLEDSFRVFLDEQLPKLLRKEDLTPEEITHLLLEILDEFRHILYHIKDSKYYWHFLEPLVWEGSSEAGSAPRGG